MNPIAFRIGHFFSWSDAWFVQRMYYPEFLHNVLLIKTLVNFLFYKMLFINFFNSFFLYSHINFYFFNNKIYLNIFIYDGSDPEYIYSWMRYLKWNKMRKLKLKSYWLKKELLMW